MSDLKKYIDKYGDIKFNEEKLNEIDIAIFTQLTYINFGVVKDKLRLNNAIKKINEGKLCKKRRYQNLINALLDKRRYKNLILSNYVYKLTDDEQFGALCIDINSDTRLVLFEGTDDMLIGWEEDFAMSYNDLIPAEIDAIKYLNRVSKDYKNIIVAGHSKGGRIAIVSVIYSSPLTKFKIKSIYSLDGPGIGEKENLFRYKLIKNKYVKFMPRYSIFGRLFRENHKSIIVDCKDKGILAHQPFSWKIVDKQFKRSEISNSSEAFYINFNKWLDKYSFEERKYFSDYLFSIFRDMKVYSLYDLRKLNKEKYDVLLNIVKNKDEKFVNMFKEFFEFYKEYFIVTTKNKVSNLINNK